MSKKLLIAGNWKLNGEKKDISFIENLLKFHSKKELWTGCFGVMMVIEYDFLNEMNKIYNIQSIVKYVHNRYQRKSLERIITCMFQKHKPLDVYFGKIQEYCDWNISYKYKEHLKYKHLPIIKIWTGR